LVVEALWVNPDVVIGERVFPQHRFLRRKQERFRSKVSFDTTRVQQARDAQNFCDTYIRTYVHVCMYRDFWFHTSRSLSVTSVKNTAYLVS
jgi:hypothetical protein